MQNSIVRVHGFDLTAMVRAFTLADVIVFLSIQLLKKEHLTLSCNYIIRLLIGFKIREN